MTDRAHTLLTGRRERMERLLGRSLEGPVRPGAEGSEETRRYLLGEAEDLYWNELEWEHITDEESLEGGGITGLTFPGLLAFVRGLLLEEVMPDALSPANPRPEVVADILDFLAARVVELQDDLADAGGEDEVRGLAEMQMTDRLVDSVLQLYHRLSEDDIERVEAGRASA